MLLLLLLGKDQGTAWAAAKLRRSSSESRLVCLLRRAHRLRRSKRCRNFSRRALFAGITSRRRRRHGVGAVRGLQDLRVCSQHLLQPIQPLLELTAVSSTQAGLLTLLVLAGGAVARAPPARGLSAIAFNLCSQSASVNNDNHHQRIAAKARTYLSLLAQLAPGNIDVSFSASAAGAAVCLGRGRRHHVMRGNAAATTIDPIYVTP